MNLQFSEEIVDKTVVFQLEGKIVSDIDTTELIEQLQKRIDGQEDTLVFNLSKLTHITSTGLNFFVRALTRTRNKEKKLLLNNLQPSVAKLFQISKLNEIFTISSESTIDEKQNNK
jgi:anti-sigma B factor antagonist